MTRTKTSEGTAPVDRGVPLFGRKSIDVGARGADALMRGVFFLGGVFVLFVAAAIVWVLLDNSVGFFSFVSPVEFFFHDVWHAVEGANAQYGIWPLVSGTLLVAAGAALIGLPLGLATAIYLAEYASPRIRGFLKPVIEVLAGIPSIVFGFFALAVISPLVQGATAPGTFLGGLFGNAGVFSAANAMIVVGIMVLPIVTSISEDALRSVPQHLREASLALGATRWETVRNVVLPSAVSGVAASFVLAVSRAIGETMAVTMAAGTQAKLTANPVDAIQTMTAFIAQKTSGDTPHQGPGFLSLFAVGAALFAFTFIMNVLAQRFVRRYREVET
ncbi:MAG: phosphate ABC transporter permease subunit PstC [Euryarchaeota archaeon]|nr:phosphate ABC transporter permease subunit PstC [Euryarchaeota archaeon]